MPKIDSTIADLVGLDGLPRQATADDGSQHVLYWDGIVRSMLAADWPPPLPTDPTPAESNAAIAAREAARQQAIHDAAALRQRVLQAAQGAVGVSVDQLTASQRNALIVLLLFQAGALDKNGVVQPLAQWVQ